MNPLKVLVCAALSATLVGFALEIYMGYGARIHSFIYVVLTLFAAWLGGYVARFISWGGLSGSLGGLLAGFYLPLPLMYFFPSTRYEAFLPWLMLSAFLGMMAGGYYLHAFFKAHRHCRDRNRT